MTPMENLPTRSQGFTELSAFHKTTPFKEVIQVLSLLDPEISLSRALGNPGHFRCDLLSLNTHGKAKIRFLVKELMHSLGKPEYALDLSESILELAFNALKANYAHAIVIDTLKPKIERNSTPSADVYEFLKSDILKEAYLGMINSKEVNQKVKDALHLEKKIFDINDRLAKNEREPSLMEMGSIQDMHAAFKNLIRRKVVSTLHMVKGPSKITLHLVNDAPISDKGIERIRQMRLRFRNYYDKKCVGQFFVDHLDESESAGFGSALIDSRLLQWGFNPDKHFKVACVGFKTCASLMLAFKAGEPSEIP